MLEIIVQSTESTKSGEFPTLVRAGKGNDRIYSVPCSFRKPSRANSLTVPTRSDQVLPVRTSCIWGSSFHIIPTRDSSFPWVSPCCKGMTFPPFQGPWSPCCADLRWDPTSVLSSCPRRWPSKSSQQASEAPAMLRCSSNGILPMRKGLPNIQWMYIHILCFHPSTYV